MPRYGFTSPGANATNAIQAFLVQRALEQRQAQQDAIAKQAQDVDQQRQAQSLKLQQQQEARIAEAQQQTIKDAENQRSFTRATTISENAMPGDPADEPTQKLLTDQGYGGQLNKVPGILVGNGDEVSQQTPDSVQMRGGSKYLAARTAADERSAEHDKDLASKETQGEADRQLKEMIARMTAEGRADSTGLRNDLLRLQTQMAQDKLEAGRKATTDAAGAVKTSRASVRDMAQSLMDDPALDGITGTIEGRRDRFFDGKAVDAKKRLDQLVGQLSLQARGQMKGQGQISDFEGRLLQNAVSAIDRAAGPEIVKQHLQEIIDAFKGDAPNSGPSTNNGGKDDAAARAAALIEKYGR